MENFRAFQQVQAVGELMLSLAEGESGSKTDPPYNQALQEVLKA